jgi:hypothetical protein
MGTRRKGGGLHEKSRRRLVLGGVWSFSFLFFRGLFDVLLFSFLLRFQSMEESFSYRLQLSQA